MDLPAAGQERVSRRRLLGAGILAAGLAMASSLLALAGRFLLQFTGREPRRQWVDLGVLASFPDGATTARLYSAPGDGETPPRPRRVYVVRRGLQVTVFDPTCTHLGCLSHWQDPAQVFFCPCHGSAFDPEGRVIAGPAPRPLEQLRAEIRGGHLYVLGA
ncbi:MAG: ubiquinol-cytochrome c reductase iron-sulfur subunit [Armatimonadetes bacterium]|nr:ubiquinol-cytochrome c reductase iron-sulfur subunit [Armatimonadota bacterium]